MILKWLINTIQPFSIRPLHVIELIPWFAGITSAFPIWYQKVESSSIFLNNYSFPCKNMYVCTQGVSEYVCLTLITRACITSIQWQKCGRIITFTSHRKRLYEFNLCGPKIFLQLTFIRKIEQKSPHKCLPHSQVPRYMHLPYFYCWNSSI